MKLQTANCAGLRPSKTEPDTGVSLPELAALMISASGMPSGKFKFTQSASGRMLPFDLARLGVGKLLDFQDDDFLDDVHQAVTHVRGVDDFVAEAVDDFALFVHHVVVFERAFADLEIVLLPRAFAPAGWNDSKAGATVPGLPPGPFFPSSLRCDRSRTAASNRLRAK